MQNRIFRAVIALAASVFLLGAYLVNNNQIGDNILSNEIDPEKQSLQFYWKDKQGRAYANFNRLNTALEEEGKTLTFAMNGGMFNKSRAPQGLYIEMGETVSPIDRNKKGYGNFYLQPNGIFYLSKAKKAFVTTTQAFAPNDDIEFATQSGPMLVIDGKIHSAFNKNSNNLHVRNGVGVLPNGHLLFALSSKKVNLYEFASFFKKRGCKNALYLDGFVSKAYMPSEKLTQLDGDFAVIIAESSNNNSPEIGKSVTSNEE